MKSNVFCKTFHCMNVYTESSEHSFALKQNSSGYTGKSFMKSIDSSGLGFQVIVSEPECRPFHSRRLSAKNIKRGTFSGTYMKSIDTLGFGIQVIVSEPECRPFHSRRLAAKNLKRGTFAGTYMKSIDSLGFGLPIICSKHNYK